MAYRDTTSIVLFLDLAWPALSPVRFSGRTEKVWIRGKTGTRVLSVSKQ